MYQSTGWLNYTALSLVSDFNFLFLRARKSFVAGRERWDWISARTYIYCTIVLYVGETKKKVNSQSLNSGSHGTRGHNQAVPTTRESREGWRGFILLSEGLEIKDKDKSNKFY